MLSILSFVFVLGILIFIHELGHFLIAKKVGIKVEAFSLGFPPNIFSKKVGDTSYCIGIIPLGGYVKMSGENPAEEVTGADHEFASKTILQRTAVIFAGPFMNYLLAMGILMSLFFISGRPVFDPDRILVGEVSEGKPASLAGLQTGDQIIAIDGVPMDNFDSLRTRINAKLNDSLRLTWIHEADTLEADIVTEVATILNEQNETDSIGLIGFTQKVAYYESLGFFNSIQLGFTTTHVIVSETVKFIGKLITGNVSAKLIGGPLFIAQQSGKEARKGASSLFFFMAVLSVNLAVLNILPIPMLDGGHLMFLIIEKLRGSPLSMKAKGVAQQIGVVLLLSLILFVTYNDIMRFING